MPPGTKPPAAPAYLGATERQVEQRCLPCVERRQRAHGFNVDRRVEDDTALERPEHVVVLHAVGCELLQLTILHWHDLCDTTDKMKMAVQGTA